MAECALSISTVPPYNITTTTAESGGTNIFTNETVTQKGVVWNTSPSPTTANSSTDDGDTSTPFDSSMTGLVANTTYYVRAYVTSNCGTEYGEEWSFKTPLEDEPGNQCDISELEILPGETFVIPEGAEIQGITNINFIESTCIDPDKIKDLEVPQCYGFLFGIPKEEASATQWGESDQTRVVGIKIKGKAILLADEVESDDGGNLPFTLLDDLTEISPEDIVWHVMCELDNTDGAREWFILFKTKPSYVNNVRLLITMSSPGLTAIWYDLVPYSKVKIDSMGYEIECDCE
jgi:hypothetical protein